MAPIVLGCRAFAKQSRNEAFKPPHQGALGPEAASARLPVVGVAPAAYRFTDEEQNYRAFLVGNNWCRVLPIAGLAPDSFARAPSEIEPLRENPLDALAAKLKERLPELLGDSD